MGCPVAPGIPGFTTNLTIALQVRLEKLLVGRQLLRQQQYQQQQQLGRQTG